MSTKPIPCVGRRGSVARLHSLRRIRSLVLISRGGLLAEARLTAPNSKSSVVCLFLVHRALLTHPLILDRPNDYSPQQQLLLVPPTGLENIGFCS